MLLAPPLPPAAASATASFYERVLVADDVDDYRHANGALDLDSLFVSETYRFDPATETGVDLVTVRLTPRKLDDIVFCSTPPVDETTVALCQIRYDVYFQSGGQGRHVNATFAYQYTDKGQGAAVVSANVTARSNITSVFFVLPRDAFGLVPGSHIEKLWATSSLVQDDAQTVQDRIPGDNKNTPANPELHPEFAALYAPNHQLQGTYDFFLVLPESPLHQRSAEGRAVRFDFSIVPTSGVSGDLLRIYWETPPQWSITPSRGDTSGGRARGMLTDLSYGDAMPFSFTATSSDLVEAGQQYTVVMHVTSSSGGSQYVPVIILVTGARFESPDHVFTLLTPGPFQAGTSQLLRVGLTDAAGAPFTDAHVGFELRREGQKVALVPPTLQDGSWNALYPFPSAGRWTLDAYLEDVEPSPHKSFPLIVEPSGPSPAGALAMGALAGIPLLLAGAGVLILWRRRRSR